MIEIIHKFTCNICGITTEETSGWHLGQEPIKPNPPRDWRIVNDLLICRKHKIKIDGKEIDTAPKWVLTNLNGDVIICSEEQGKEIQIKEALEIFDNAFDTEGYDEKTHNG